ncbi:MAG: hypothetical protein ABIP90_04595 [Vicinamibacterales bacterium]
MTLHLVTRHFTRLLLVISTLVPAAACAAAGQPGQASSFVIVDSFQAAPGAKPTAFGGSLASDVVSTIDGVPTVLEDLGRASFRLAMKDPTITAPSAINFVTLKGYRVTFSRSDGRNTPGLDVPYAFDGAMSATVGISPATAAIVLVRVQAKKESPLTALKGMGGAVAISTFADVVFYGTDQAGHDVTTSARISVTFADWGDAG